MARDTRRRRGRGRRIFVGLLIALALLWGGFWIAASYFAGIGIERAVAAMSAGGRAVACLDYGMSGFPLTLDLRCNGGKLASGDSLSGSLAGVSASAFLYRPGHVEATVVGPFTVDAPALGLTLKASWSHASGSLDIGLGGLRRASGALDDFLVEMSGDSPQLTLRRLGVKNAFLSAGPAGDNAYRVVGGVSDIAIEPSGGEALPALSGEVALIAEEFGGSLGADPRKALAAWVARGGALKVERLVFAAGQTSANASGALTVAPTGLVSGRLNVRVVGLEKLPGLAEALKPGSGELVAQVIGGVSAFMKPAADGSGAREIGLVIRNGVVFAGMFPLPFVIAPVRF